MGKFSLFLFHFDLHTNHYKQKQAIYIHNLWNSSTASSWPWLLPALLLVDDLNFVSHVFHAPTTLPCLILKYLIFIKAFGVPTCNWHMLLRRIYPRQNWNFWFAHQVAAHLQHQVQKIKYRSFLFQGSVPKLTALTAPLELCARGQAKPGQLQSWNRITSIKNKWKYIWDEHL